MLAGGVLLAFLSAGCGSPDSRVVSSSPAAQPADSQAVPARGPASAPDLTPQAPGQVQKPPVNAAREATPREATPREPDGVPPVITTPPEDRTVLETGPFSMRVDAKGTGPLRYEWTKDGRPGVVSNDAEFWMVPKLEDAGTYRVEVSNPWGKATAYCRLTVNPRLKRP